MSNQGPGAPLLLPLLLLVVGTAAAPSVAAQDAPIVPPGSKVRIASPLYTGESIFTRMEEGRLEIWVQGQVEPVRVPRGSVTRLELQRLATRREGATRGALWGGGILGPLGILMTDRAEDDRLLESAAYSVLAGVLWGAAVGFFIPQHRWEPVPLPK